MLRGSQRLSSYLFLKRSRRLLTLLTCRTGRYLSRRLVRHFPCAFRYDSTGMVMSGQ